jgi:hypothetical protein
MPKCNCHDPLWLERHNMKLLLKQWCDWAWYEGFKATGRSTALAGVAP